MATTPGKTRYHHGDLRNALISAAVALATEGGPERVVLREAARRVGVSPTAAYRHFAGQAELLHEVRVRGQFALATSMERAAAEAPETGDPGEAAELRVIAFGRGYVDFALTQPGLYRAAFCNPHLTGETHDEWTGLDPAGPEPEFRAFAMLTDALDTMAATGRLPAANRAGAEVTVWSVAHGLSMLILEGPMGRLGPEERAAVVDRGIATITAGLTTDQRAGAGGPAAVDWTPCGLRADGTRS